MSQLVVNDWKFGKVQDAEAGMRAAIDYVKTLRAEDRGCLLSLWTRSWQDASRHFHVPVFASAEAMDSAFGADDTASFADRLYPLVSEEGVHQPKCDVVLSSGGDLDELLEPGEPGGSLVVNDFTFADAGGVGDGLEAAARYVVRLKERPALLTSLWARDRSAPLRFFHVIAFADQGTAGSARRWPETLEFAEALFPLLDPNSVEQVFTEILVSSGGRLPHEDLDLRRS